MVRPMLDDLELQQVQTIEVDGDQVWTQHSIPALEGDFFQGLGRRANQVTLAGVLTGAEVADGLKNLRSKFRSAAPVAFVADIATATHIDQVLIEEMGVRELAGKPSRFEYAFTLREYMPATPPERKKPPPPPKPPVIVLEATLIVEVIVEGQPNFDHDNTLIEVFENASTRQTTIPNTKRTSENMWEEQDFRPGTYTIKATTAVPNSLTNSEPAQVELGKTEHVKIYLRQGTKIAQYLSIHYWFDKAFIEPCMRPVMRQVAAHLTQNPTKKLLVLGHTDLVGGDDYNQSLAERRARAAYAYLTTGADLNTAVAEWDELRKTRTTGITRTVNDTWGVRQYQLILFDLGFYSGVIKDTHDTPTDNAVRAFQSAHGLGVDGQVGDQTWPVLIREYIQRDALSINPDQLLPNAKDACVSGKVRWLGAGELDPLKDTQDAWRPNRRTEFLFVPDDTFQNEVKIPEPHTLKMPALKYDQWCLGSTTETPNCFTKPHPGITRKQTCTQPPTDDRWERQPLETQTVVVNGRITHDDGTPFANKEYVLIAPDGEFMNGERPSGTDRGRPIFGRTDANGNFTDKNGKVGYPDNPKRIGTFTLEIQSQVMARLKGTAVSTAKGPVVCKRMANDSDSFEVVVQSGTSAVEAALAVTNNVAPFDKTVNRVQIEGVLNRDRTSYDIGDLFGNQADSLFRVRADLPSVAAATVTARLTSTATDRSTIETHTITLTRTTGVRFASLPLLAVPRALPRADITFVVPQTLDVIRSQAGGKLRVEILGIPAAPSPVQVNVRGRVLEMCTITIQGAAPTINADMTTANRVMAQCGIEFRILRGDTVNNAALLDIQQPSCPLTIGGDNNRGPEEQALFALGRTDCTTNFIVYFVRSNSLGLFGCSAYPVGQPGVTVADAASQYTFCHEIGHVLHLPHDGRANNLMTGAGTNSLPGNPANVHLLPDQCTLMNNSGFLVFRE